MRRTATVANDTDLWTDFKRQSIQQAVIRLMCRDGMRSVTMERVAHETGIAKGTVYLHYRDKQELLDSVKDSSLAPLTEKLDEIFTSTASPVRKLQTFATRYLGYFDDKRDLFRILLYEREVTQVQGSRFQTDRYRHLLDGVARIVRDGMRQHIFRDVDAQNVAAMFLESNIAILNQRLLTPKPAPVEDDAAMVSELFVRGLKRPRSAK
jgi:AcrR family transcriptional regulator